MKSVQITLDMSELETERPVEELFREMATAFGVLLPWMPPRISGRWATIRFDVTSDRQADALVEFIQWATVFEARIIS